MNIESKRLYIRPFSQENFKNFESLHKNNETAKLMGKGLISDQEIEKRFNNVLTHQEELGFSAWAVYEKNSDKFVGRCGLVKIGTLTKTDEDNSDKIEIGYAFLPEFWGKGYCQEIVPAVLEYGFKTIGLENIFAKTAKENIKSRHLLINKFHFKHHSGALVEGRESDIFILSAPDYNIDRK
jgi:ribosomal-protein-alanine N-acetyltransferase